MAQYKLRYSDFLPRVGYTFSYNGIQLATSSVTLGFLQPFSDNKVKLDLSTTIGQYPKSNTATSGEGRNCSLAIMTASMAGALRKARMNRELALRAPRNACHLEKMTVQE